MISKLDTIQKLLIVLCPIIFMLGPFLSNLHITILSILFITTLIVKKKIKIFNNIYTFLFLIFYFIILLSTFLSDNPFFSLEASLFYFRFAIFGFAVGYYIQKYDIIKKYFLYVSCFCLFFLFVDSLYQYYLSYNIFSMPLSDSKRVSSIFGEELIMGGYVSKLLILILICIFSNNYIKLNKYFFLYSIILISLVLVFLSGERTAFLLFIIFLFLLFVYLNEFFSNILLLLIILSGLIISLVSNSVYERMYVRTFDQIFSDSRMYIFSIHHQAHYETAIKMFIDKPLLGVGPKQFRNICDDKKYKTILFSKNKEPYNGCQTHPHNIYLQLLAETGLIGFLFLFLVLLNISYKILYSQIFSVFYNSKPYKLSSYLCLCGVFINIFPLAPSGNFFGSSYNFMFYLCIGFLLGDIGKKIYEK